MREVVSSRVRTNNKLTPPNKENYEEYLSVGRLSGAVEGGRCFQGLERAVHGAVVERLHGPEVVHQLLLHELDLHLKHKHGAMVNKHVNMVNTAI
jgi:hypothetical protein